MKLTLDRMCIQAGKLCASCEELYALIEHTEKVVFVINFGSYSLLSIVSSYWIIDMKTIKKQL